MSQIRIAAGEIADELHENGVVLISRTEVNNRVKDRDEISTISHDEIRQGFEESGWGYSRQLYFHEARLREKAHTASGEFRSNNHLIITESEVIDEIATPVSPGDEEGWRRGKAISIIRGVFESDGWKRREAEKEIESGFASRTFYFYPLYEVIHDLHPNGRHPFSAQEIFSYYISQSIEEMVLTD